MNEQLYLANQAHVHLQTVSDWLRYILSNMNKAEIFFGHGCDNAFDEAVHLLQHALYLPHETPLESLLNACVLPEETQRIMHLLELRVVKRLPLPYVTGRAYLLNHMFFVNEDVLIPRSFIAETLPSQIYPWIHKAENVQTILDLCTGSGCLAILAQNAFPHAEVIAADISPKALKVAQKNLKLHGLEQDIKLIESDLFNHPTIQTYDLIICNPPYVNQDSIDALPAEYLAEPNLALAGGTDGMDLVRRVINQAAQHLNANGLLLLEIGNEKHYFDQAFKNLEATWLEVSAGYEQLVLIRRESLLAFTAC